MENYMSCSDGTTTPDPVRALSFEPDQYFDEDLSDPAKQKATLKKAVPNSTALMALSTSEFQVVQPRSQLYLSDTAWTFVSPWGNNQRLDIQRADLQVIARIRELGTYPDGWDGAEVKAPTTEAVRDAEGFARSLPLEKIHAPHVSLASDGEINFLWILPHFRLDLGFYGDGSYSYYGRKPAGEEFIADEKSCDQPLENEILQLISKYDA